MARTPAPVTLSKLSTIELGMEASRRASFPYAATAVANGCSDLASATVTIDMTVIRLVVSSAHGPSRLASPAYGSSHIEDWVLGTQWIPTTLILPTVTVPVLSTTT